jgi:hypothetical protein
MALIGWTALLILGCGGGGVLSQSNPGTTPLGIVTGTVVQNSGGIAFAWNGVPIGATPAVGAKVSVGNSSVVTGKSGTFILNRIPIGTQTLTVSPTSGRQITQPVSVIPNATVQVGIPPVSRATALGDVAAIVNAQVTAPSPKTRSTISAPAWMSIFESQQPLPTGTAISDFLDDGTSVETLTSPEWVVYVDTAPQLRFGHPVEVFTVDPTTGVTAERDSQSWPAFNGSPFYDSSLLDSSALDLVQQATGIPSDVAETPAARPKMQISTIGRAQAETGSGKTYALIVIGGSTNALYPNDDFSKDIQNIQPIFGTPSIPATAAQDVVITNQLTANPIQTIKQDFNSLAAQSKPGDTFVFYLSSHGELENPKAVPLYNGYKAEMEWNNGENLAVLGVNSLDFTKVNACNILVIVDTCYSGNWNDALVPIFSKVGGKHFAVISSTTSVLPGIGSNAGHNIPGMPNATNGGPMTILFSQAMKTLPTTKDFNGDILQAWNSIVPNFELAAPTFTKAMNHRNGLLYPTPEIAYREIKPTDCCPCGGEGVGVK